MEIAAKLARSADKVLNFIILSLLLLALLYGGYALWDTWQVYDSAGMDEALYRYRPTAATAEDGSNPTLHELAALNPDVRAWLCIDGTNIDYPVAQGADNVKYVNTDVYGSYSLSGCIFLDFSCAPDFSDFYSLLYGHHMDGGMMFGDLAHFLDADYFDAHRTGTLYLPDSTHEIELFACLSVDAYDELVFDPRKKTEADKAALLVYIENTAINYREIGVETGDRIIGLSTCSDASTNGRTVVYGRLTERTYLEQGGVEETP